MSPPVPKLEWRDVAIAFAGHPVLDSLDLVVTVDTSVGHLAAAMGRPAWILLATAPDWRWLLERSDSPWYPTVRLFRQTVARQWRDVMERVAAALRSGL